MVKEPPAQVATMYSTKEDSMTISVSFYMWHNTTPIKALLDSSATHNFIDKWTVNTLRISTKELPQPLQVNSIDSLENQAGRVTLFCNLWVWWGLNIQKMGFYIANLGWDQIILGHPWVLYQSNQWTNSPNNRGSTWYSQGKNRSFIPEYYHRHTVGILQY